MDTTGIKMTLPLQIHIASAEAMMGFYDPVRIHGCCAPCPDHGRVWSCPPHTEPTLERLPAWDHAVLVFGRIAVEPGSSQERMITGFHEARKVFRSRLLEAEEAGTTALVAGYCQGCEVCARPNPCPDPSALRYSLEALGFDVTGLFAGIARQRIHWPEEGLPESLLAVGALLCRGQAQAERLGQGLLERFGGLSHDWNVCPDRERGTVR